MTMTKLLLMALALAAAAVPAAAEAAPAKDAASLFTPAQRSCLQKDQCMAKGGACLAAARAKLGKKLKPMRDLSQAKTGVQRNVIRFENKAALQANQPVLQADPGVRKCRAETTACRRKCGVAG